MLRFVAHVVSPAAEDAKSRGLAVTFEAALASLAQLTRMFIEPDGSFVWRGTTDDGLDWQVDGSLVDRGDTLDYVELKGTCPSERLDEVLAALGWPEHPLAFQLPRQGLVLSEAEFRRQAATPAGAG